MGKQATHLIAARKQEERENVGVPVFPSRAYCE
jgi:hypothetical protein